MARKQKKYHYIYKTTCSVNGKYYIGMHSTDNLEDGYLGSGKRLWRSINYHGKENHEKVILEYCKNRVELKKREKDIINEGLLSEKLCMNLKPGGEGGFVNEEHRLKFIESLKKSQKEATKNSHISMTKLRKNNPEWLNNLKNKISEGLKKNPNVKKGGFKNKKHTEETKKKMSEKAKEKTGNKNSQYGTCWITNGFENKKIKKTNTIPNGWYLGRKIKKVL